jgi:hypothetical protein
LVAVARQMLNGGIPIIDYTFRSDVSGSVLLYKFLYKPSICLKNNQFDDVPWIIEQSSNGFLDVRLVQA